MVRFLTKWWSRCTVVDTTDSLKTPPDTGATVVERQDLQREADSLAQREFGQSFDVLRARIERGEAVEVLNPRLEMLTYLLRCDR